MKRRIDLLFTLCVATPLLPLPCLMDQTDCPFLSYSTCIEEIASFPLVTNICLIPEKTPSSHGLPPLPPHGPGPLGVGSLTTPRSTYIKGLKPISKVLIGCSSNPDKYNQSEKTNPETKYVCFNLVK